ncbi:MAG: hypothetical protein J6N45_09760 [Alphaproteobacteria bacterium]|nr:hypothetical protein [Alphaproteobacteria bacterium]
MSFRGNPNVVNLTDQQIITGYKEFDGVSVRGLTANTGNWNTITAENSATVNHVVTTAAIKKAAIGCFKYGNGNILNWGTSSHGSAAITVTFATPFSSTNYAVTAILNTTSASTTERYCPIVYSKTTTNCVIWIKGTDGNISWQATGY